MQTVVIKSFSNGIKLFFDKDADFSTIIKEVNDKFAASKDFFKNSKLTVSFEGREFNDDEEILLIKTMEAAADMNILYLVGKDDETAESFKKSTDTPYFNEDSNEFCGKIYKGNVKKNERLEFNSSVVIVGDVEPSSLIKASGDVIILGGLYGNITCTTSSDGRSPFIYAQEMQPERIIINDLRYYPKEKSKWSIRPKYQAKIAYVKDNTVMVDICTRELFDLLQRL